MEETELKLKTARTLKWNTIDKFASQVFYGVTGVVLANLLSKEDFGLVGAMLVFQAFASLFVDSGFCAALIQKNRLLKPTIVRFFISTSASASPFMASYGRVRR